MAGWRGRTLWGGRTFHEHFTIPSPELEGGDRDLLGNETPRFREMFQRYQIECRLQHGFYDDHDHMLAGFHVGEAVYARCTMATAERESTPSARPGGASQVSFLRVRWAG